MNYPIWELTTIGGSTLIAVISVLHVYIAHLAVGGGLFIWLTDLKGFRENNPEIHNYVYKHTWFFLLLTMVFGGVTGVGIWFIISLVNPATTSALIHTFVFGWAIEWVFFVGEISALLIYYYKFHSLNRKSRLNIAFLYFLFAWLSLVVINGIISFMLTPGKWLETGNFWHGFFNPTYFPSMLFRTFATVMIAGLFAYVTIVFLKDSDFRQNMMKYASRWLLISFIGLVPTGLWYYFAIPREIRQTAFFVNPQTTPFYILLIVASIILFAGGVIFSFRTRPAVQKALTFILLLVGLGWMAGFEYSREIARKPNTIRDYIYSTSIPKAEVQKLNASGVLPAAKWVEIKEITPENQLKAGKELFNIQCLSCHTVGGIRNDILPRTKNYPYMGVLALLTGQGKVHPYMPEFVGTPAEKEALAHYIVAGLHQKEVVKEVESYEIQEVETEIPPFNKRKADYVLLVWNDLGMHCISDSDPWFVILPPANTMEAQLIKRGPTPQIITDGVELTYRVEVGFENPAAHVPFWEYAEKNYGVKLEKNVGLAGKGLSGEFDLDEEKLSFIAKMIPVVPYADDGSFNPYPTFTVEARDANTKEILATTKVVTPTSTEMGCRNCHGGDWRVDGIAGVSDETAMNILRVHDRISGTNLLEEAQKGNPRQCQSCHADPAVGADGKPELLNLSAAMHGFHANYMPLEGARACVMCHPAYSKGRTRCSRGIHGAFGITCVDCHGMLQDHAIGLLKGQEGKNRVSGLLANLTPTKVASVEEVNGRTPWLNEPDCLTCHEDFEKPAPDVTAFNVWNEEFEELYRNRSDNAMIRCPACHGSTHAEYPASSPLGGQRDNIQPMQYSGMPYPIGANISCEVCHVQKMTDPIHHENMYRPFRNADKVADLLKK
ncbi:MAG: cytochrome c family protein [Calditrichia bacterium]